MSNILNKYDELLHLSNEREDLSAQQVFDRAQELFPNLSKDTSKHYHDTYLTPSKIEMYAYHRSTGNSPKTSAHAIGLSYKLIKDALTGKGVSFNVFTTIAKQELYCRAELRTRHIAKLEASDKPLLFLQTMFPDEFPRQDALKLDANIVHTISNADIEQELRKRGIPTPSVPLEDI